ncbi:MAG: helix-turn-helix domain-containing protein, partial [Patescibacteria group bacterium]
SAGRIFILKINEDVFQKTYDNYKSIITHYKIAEEKGNVLTLKSNGYVEYVSKNGEIHKTTLGIHTNYYNLLQFLAKNPRQRFNAETLAKELGRKELTDDFADNDRRVRDAIKYIKEKLGTPGDAPFVTANGFELNCDVFLKVE